MSEWIDVDERLPEKNETCWVKTLSKVERLATYYPADYRDGFMESLGYEWVFEEWDPSHKWEDQITHWHPLPKKD